MNKHHLVILAAITLALAFWGLIEFTPGYTKELLGGFVAALVGLTVELIGLLFIERGETISKIATIESLATEATPRFNKAEAEAKSIQSYVSSLEQQVSSLEQSITHGLLAQSLDDPANVWQNVLADARKAVRSIYVAITVPDFSTPKQWDEQLADYIKDFKDQTNFEIPYVVAIYSPRSEWTNEAVQRLLQINLIYQERGLSSVIHGFVEQPNYFRFNIIVIDRRSVGFLWTTTKGNKSTKGIYFREAPDLAGEMTDWFVNSCLPHMTDIRDIATARQH